MLHCSLASEGCICLATQCGVENTSASEMRCHRSSKTPAAARSCTAWSFALPQCKLALASVLQAASPSKPPRRFVARNRGVL